MRDEYSIKIKNLRKWSELVVNGNQISFSCVVGSGYSTRNRRQLLLTIYRAVLPHLDFVKRSYVHHNHQMAPEIYGKDEFINLSTKQGIDVVNDATKIGYFIRGIRTKLGKTQKEFAHELSISSTYLSRIEKGYRTPSSKIMRKIYKIEKPAESI